MPRKQGIRLRAVLYQKADQAREKHENQAREFRISLSTDVNLVREPRRGRQRKQLGGPVLLICISFFQALAMYTASNYGVACGYSADAVSADFDRSGRLRDGEQSKPNRGQVFLMLTVSAWMAIRVRHGR